jgi:hypothetical protein
MSRAPLVRPPRLAVWLVDLFVTDESIAGDLLEEFSDLASNSGVASARRWYWRQGVKTIAHLVGTRFLVAPWSTTAAVVGGFLLLRFGFRWQERAIFAVLDRYSVFEHHFNAYIFFASYGLDIGRVILSMFVGCIVALAAKGREMVAATTLGLVLCAMVGAASLVLVARGYDSFLWTRTLPWHCASSIAIVVGGVIVRESRSGVSRRPSGA